MGGNQLDDLVEGEEGDMFVRWTMAHFPPRCVAPHPHQSRWSIGAKNKSMERKDSRRQIFLGRCSCSKMACDYLGAKRRPRPPKERRWEMLGASPDPAKGTR
jgi:hypothetical protein